MIFKKTFFIFFLTLAISPATFPQIFSEKYDTKNHPKAKGAWFTVRYPNGWESNEGERPNIVQKFSGDYKGYFTTLIIQVKKADESLENDCKSLSAVEMADILASPADGAKSKNARKIKHENKTAFLFDSQIKIERAGRTTMISNKAMAICNNDKMILLLCGNMKFDKASQSISSTFSDLEVAAPICFQYFNSLVLMDNY